MTNREKIEELRKRREAAILGGGKDRLEKQRQGGKLTARDRLAALLDEGSFQEQYLFAQHRATHFGLGGKDLPADGVVTGCGTVAGRQVHLASQDFTVVGGAVGEVHADKIVEMMDLSKKTGTPFVFVNDSGGARIQEGIDALAAYARIFYKNVELSGLVPQISLICGPCAGGAAYSPALTDFIIQTKQAQMFITGPAVIKQVTGENVTAEALGGPEVQMKTAGNIHFIAEDDTHAIDICKRLLSYLPSNNHEDPPQLPHDGMVEYDEKLNSIIPDEAKRGYNVKDIITRLADEGSFLEVMETFAPNAVIGFGRIVGHTVGFVANQPMALAGVLDIDSSDKIARFVRFCNAFNVPLVTLVDVPGFLPGTKQEYGGIIRHGAKVLFAYSAATVPKIAVILRKAYGGAYVAMSAKHLGADRVAAWPSAEVAVMGAEGAVAVVFKKEIDAAEDKEAKRNELIEEYRRTFSSPYMAASRRLVDDIIEPAETRRYLAMALEAMRTKRELRPEKKHGLIPL
ncbi:MAG: acyl-CoA carboxylase subunit beta [Candidatus Sumerlaeia bacterium]|nr:acyl-CoA carboxylase subunit beta [Candidatus Sumerlaeia bacterium]